MKVRLIAIPAVVALLAACSAGTQPADPSDESTAMASEQNVGSTSSDDADPAADEDADTADADGAAIPAEFDFVAQTVDGETFEGADLAGTDVVLWFWAPWCPTCRAQSSTINAVIPSLPEGVQLVGIAGLSEDLEHMQEFVTSTGTTRMTHVADLEGTIYRGFEVSQQSTLMFVDDSGERTLMGSGATSTEILEQAEILASS